MQKNFLNETDNAILVGVGVGRNTTEDALDELSTLCKTANIVEVGRIIQNRHDIDATYYVGKGKVEEIRLLVEETGANVVVFDVELSGSKVRNLERELEVPVLDRSKVILDIFASRAQSREGQLQVELAQLKYNLPRLASGAGAFMSKMKNAVGMRGPGEKKLEMDKRKIRDEIVELQKEIEKLKGNRAVNKKQSVKSGKARVGLVGYTNSGKTTLLSTFAKTDVGGEDKLFATLDTKTATLFITPDVAPEDYDYEKHAGKEFLITDTVGFVDKLPHEFISAFESTLAETRESDLLLHIIDVSNPDVVKQISVVSAVMEKIGAHEIPVVYVLNKVDRLGQTDREIIRDEIVETFGAGKSGDKCGIRYIEISARKNQNIDALKQLIFEMLG